MFVHYQQLFDDKRTYLLQPKQYKLKVKNLRAMTSGKLRILGSCFALSTKRAIKFMGIVVLLKLY